MLLIIFGGIGNGLFVKSSLVRLANWAIASEIAVIWLLF